MCPNTLSLVEGSGEIREIAQGGGTGTYVRKYSSPVGWMIFFAKKEREQDKVTFRGKKHYYAEK